MTDTSAENAPTIAPSISDINDGSRRPEDRFPPKFVWWKWVVLGLTYVAQIVALLGVVDQFWFQILSSREWIAYLGFGVLLGGIFLVRYLRHKILVHSARCEDHSEVDALFVEVRTVEPRLTDPERKPDDFGQKMQQLNDEVQRLEKLGPKGWTEFQVLSLSQMLVDFLKLHDLKTRARLSLAELEEYAEDSAYRYDIRHLAQWQDNIDDAIKNIDAVEDKPAEQDRAAERLRAELRTLLEHVAGYQANWAEGSAVVRDLMICGAAAVPIFLVMGLLPFLHPAGDEKFGVLDWGLLGISGSLTAVLLSIRNSDVVEVGNTEGRKELWRAVLGATLGFVAGVLIHSIISGGLLSAGAAVPDLASVEPKDISLSILWAFGSGMAFDGILQRVRSPLEKSA